MSLRIKDWQKFQHFKDRTPPWVKLYRDILDDPDWHELDGESAKVLTMLWLIASEDDTHTGTLPEVRKLAFRLRIKESQLKQILVRLHHWLIQDDIETISTGYRSDAPERETERETEEEGETEKKPRAARTPPTPAQPCPPDVDAQVWTDWLSLRRGKKAAVTYTVIEGARTEAKKAGMTFEAFLRIWCRRGSQGLESDWIKPHERGSPPTSDTTAEAAKLLGFEDERVIDA